MQVFLLFKLKNSYLGRNTNSPKWSILFWWHKLYICVTVFEDVLRISVERIPENFYTFSFSQKFWINCITENWKGWQKGMILIVWAFWLFETNKSKLQSFVNRNQIFSMNICVTSILYERIYFPLIVYLSFTAKTKFTTFLFEGHNQNISKVLRTQLIPTLVSSRTTNIKFYKNSIIQFFFFSNKNLIKFELSWSYKLFSGVARISVRRGGRAKQITIIETTRIL